MYKVSVVVPIYNVEQYIIRCAESLFGQTLDDIQFIFVDDASPDKSVQLLEQTIERFPWRKDHTIILHHPRNLGLPTARATGLERVEAPYVAHCDSDDYVEPNMYEKLYECAMRNDSDIVTCGRILHRIKGTELKQFDTPFAKESFIHGFLYGRISPYVWPRLTKTAIYRQVRFPTANYLEDWVQTAQLLTYASRVSFLDDCLYHHIQNPLSITNDRRPDSVDDKIRQCIANYDLMHDFVIRHHQVREKDFTLKKESIRNNFLFRIKRKQYLRIFPELNFSIFFCRELSWRYRASRLLISLGLYPTARAIYRFIEQNIGIRQKTAALSASVDSTRLPFSDQIALSKVTGSSAAPAAVKNL